MPGDMPSASVCGGAPPSSRARATAASAAATSDSASSASAAPAGGRLDAVGGAIDEGHAELRLQPRDRAAHGLLGDVQLARGLRERPVPDDGGEHGERAEVGHNDRL